MSASPLDSIDSLQAKQHREAALTRLREATNPFEVSVATAGTEEDCVYFDIRDFHDSQRADLQAIVDLYREPTQPSRVFPILGDPGTGKTHLLNTFQDELEKLVVAQGKESLLVVANHFTLGVDATDFFLWQIVDHLLENKGPGERLLRVLSERLAARLLAEKLRRMLPHQQWTLIPPRNFWERVRLWLGRPKPAAVQAKLDALRLLAEQCDTSSVNLREACVQAGLKLDLVESLIKEHLQRTESKDVAGTLREKLYSRLVTFALLGNKKPFEDFLTGEGDESPQHVAGAGQLTRRLLSSFIQLFREFHIPVVLAFDQLEEHLKSPGISPEKQLALAETFADALTKLVNNVPNVCLLAFIERGLWNEVIGRLDEYVRDRLDQAFALPGRPTRRAIEMPHHVNRKYLVLLVQKRVRRALGEFDSTGLPDVFPFSDEQFLELNEPTIRRCLRRLCVWYNEILFPSIPGPAEGPPVSLGPRPPQVDQALLGQLGARWQTALASARSRIEGNEPRPTLIPVVQTAVDCWLTHLLEQGITGSGPWANVELVTDTNKGPYGYLNVIRFDSPVVPGVGIAAWLAGTRGKAKDLRSRLGFFEQSPCKIRSLVLFHQGGEKSVKGESKEVLDAAVKMGRAIRVEDYKQEDLEALFAFPLWLQAVRPDIDAAGLDGQATLNEFVTRLSGQLLHWIDSWRQPPGRTT